MPITLRGVTSPIPNISGPPYTVNLPSGTAVGDVTIIAACHAATSSSAVPDSPTTPTGWTTLMSVPGFLLCYRVYQAGDPTSVTTTWGGTEWTTLCAISYTGCDTANPIDGINYCVEQNRANTASPYRAPSVAPRYASGQIVCFYGYGTSSSGTVITLPGTLTSRAASTAGPSLTIADAAAGATNTPTGDQVATNINTAGYLQFGCQVLLKASGAATLTQASNFVNMAGVMQLSPSASTSVTLPSLAQYGMQANDLLLLNVVSSATVTPPAGWTTLQTTTDGIVCYRVAQAGDTNTPAYTLGTSAGSACTLTMLRAAYNAGSVAPAVDTSGKSTAASTTSVASPSLTPATAADYLALYAGSGTGTAATWSFSAGVAKESADNSGPTNAFAFANPSANPSGSFTCTSTVSLASLSTWAVLARLPAPPAAQAQPMQMIIT